MPTVLLVRHAQASFGASDYDVLSPHGLEQAAALAGDLARRRIRIDRVISGSAARQRGTAEPIAAAAGRPVSIDPRWDEYSADDVLAHHSTATARLDRPADSTAPPLSSREFQDLMDPALLAWVEAGKDCPTAEPWAAFSPRVAAALEDVLAELGSGETAVVATSGGVVAATCVALLGLPAQAFVAFNRVTANTGVTKIVHGRSDTTLVSFNEHAHLERDGRSLVTYR
jgi:broad specificity phosphatase PhoE